MFLPYRLYMSIDTVELEVDRRSDSSRIGSKGVKLLATLSSDDFQLLTLGGPCPPDLYRLPDRKCIKVFENPNLYLN